MLRNVQKISAVRRQCAFITPLIRWSSSNTNTTASSSSSKSTETTAASQAAATQASNERDRAEKENDAVVATQVGALANVGLAGTKGIIGYGVNSTALMADAANSLGDLLIDAVVYYTIKGNILPPAKAIMFSLTLSHCSSLHKLSAPALVIIDHHHRLRLRYTEARKKATPAHPWGRGKVTHPTNPLTVLLFSLLSLSSLFVYAHSRLTFIQSQLSSTSSSSSYSSYSTTSSQIEPLGALTIGGLLLATSGGIGYQAIMVMYDMVVVHPDGAGHFGGAAAELLVEQSSSSAAAAAIPPPAIVPDVASSSSSAAASSSTSLSSSSSAHPISPTTPSSPPAFGR